jgi:hypothetical protein
VPEVPDQSVFHGLISQIGDGRMIGCTTSIGNQNVNASKVRHSSINDGLAVFALLNVSGNEVHIGTSVQFIKSALCFRFVATINDYFGTLIKEGLRDSESDTSGSSSYTSDFSIK